MARKNNNSKNKSNDQVKVVVGGRDYLRRAREAGFKGDEAVAEAKKRAAHARASLQSRNAYVGPDARDRQYRQLVPTPAAGPGYRIDGNMSRSVSTAFEQILSSPFYNSYYAAYGTPDMPVPIPRTSISMQPVTFTACQGSLSYSYSFRGGADVQYTAIFVNPLAYDPIQIVNATPEWYPDCYRWVFESDIGWTDRDRTESTRILNPDYMDSFARAGDPIDVRWVGDDPRVLATGVDPAMRFTSDSDAGSESVRKAGYAAGWGRHAADPSQGGPEPIYQQFMGGQMDVKVSVGWDSSCSVGVVDPFSLPYMVGARMGSSVCDVTQGRVAGFKDPPPEDTSALNVRYRPPEECRYRYYHCGPSRMDIGTWFDASSDKTTLLGGGQANVATVTSRLMPGLQGWTPWTSVHVVDDRKRTWPANALYGGVPYFVGSNSGHGFVIIQIPERAVVNIDLRAWFSYNVGLDMSKQTGRALSFGCPISVPHSSDVNRVPEAWTMISSGVPGGMGAANRHFGEVGLIGPPRSRIPTVASGPTSVITHASGQQKSKVLGLLQKAGSAAMSLVRASGLPKALGDVRSIVSLMGLLPGGNIARLALDGGAFIGRRLLTQRRQVEEIE